MFPNKIYKKSVYGNYKKVYGYTLFYPVKNILSPTLEIEFSRGQI